MDDDRPVPKKLHREESSPRQFDVRTAKLESCVKE